MPFGSWPLLVMDKRRHGGSCHLHHAPSTVVWRVEPRNAVPTLASALCGQHKAALEELEAGTATHLTLERFHTIHVALHRAVTPGECHASVDRVIIVAPPFRKPLQRYQGTFRRAGQPGVQLCWLPLAHQLRNILGERDGGGELGILGCELRQEVLLLGRALLRPSQDEPSGPARGQGAVRRRGHTRQGVAWSPLSRCLALRLAHALGVAGNGDITAGVTTLLERSEAS
jgi:hypothetical protein